MRNDMRIVHVFFLFFFTEFIIIIVVEIVSEVLVVILLVDTVLQVLLEVTWPPHVVQTNNTLDGNLSITLKKSSSKWKIYNLPYWNIIRFFSGRKLTFALILSYSPCHKSLPLFCVLSVLILYSTLQAGRNSWHGRHFNLRQ